MKVLGIVAEYNPFHNGHLYHINQSKKLTNSDAVVCVISGNFVQRGNTSLIDKWSKTEMALLNGADLVIELPTIYSVSSAENFAEGSMKLLNSLGVVDTISFGSECGDITTLDNIATVLHEEPSEYITMLNRELKLGNSFPKSREKSLLLYLNDIRKYANVLSSPNNILGIEYLKALKKYNYKMFPITVKRVGAKYNDINIIGGFSSATAIRELVAENKYDSFKDIIPANALSILKNKIERGEIVEDLSLFENEILYNLRKMTIEEIVNIPDVSEGLENSIKNAADSCNNLNDLISFIKSKRYTLTRIYRILVYVLLNITKSDMENSRKVKQPYVRVLGFSNRGKELLSNICTKNSKLPIITSLKHFTNVNTNKILKRMIDIDIFATNVYTLGYKYNSVANLDYTKSIIKL